MAGFDGDKGRFWRAPLDAGNFTRKRGHVSVNIERCMGCKFFIQFCPMDVLAESSKINSKGHHYPEMVRPQDCTGCALCEHICPEFAIVVTKEGEVPVSVKF